MGVLLEMLYSKISFRNLYESHKQLYYYGREIRRTRSPRTVFTFIVLGSQSILDIFKAPLETNFETLPTDSFEVCIKIHTKGQEKFGFQQENFLELKSEENISPVYILSRK